ncbi:histidine kinase [Microbacterium sp. ET2]|uniref:sensor histidine kinase n=1 Tax=Microbacterium albipurpureum TaxID=3050384 RepID=UPI00259C9CF6|nr:ATP-binding protein [Microbacterium sp. ET2 (Ac-2212)]WJL94802.1 histidine kinase [Microbacterium sp. ET2 (Ac-2212)]
MTTAARRAVAIVVWVTSWAFAVAALIIGAVADLPPDPLPGVFLSQAPEEMKARFGDIGVTVALLYGPVAALILFRRPHPVGIILAVHAVGSGVTAFGVEYGLLGAETGGLPLWGLAVYAAGWGFVPGTFLTAVVPLLVTRTPLPRWQRMVVALGVAAALAAFWVSLTQAGTGSPVNPLAIANGAYQAAIPSVYEVAALCAVGMSVLSAGVLVSRWSRSRGRARIDLSWLTVGFIVVTLSYIVLILPAGIGVPGWVIEVGIVAPILGQVLMSAGIVVMILGQRLAGVEVAISRILLWLLLSVTGVALYFAVVVTVPLIFPTSGTVLLVVPLVVALAVLPLRAWLQRRVDLLVYGDGADATQVLARLGAQIGGLTPGPRGLASLAETIRRVLRLARVEIRAGDIAAMVGEGGARSVVVPLPGGLGQMVAAPPVGQRLDRRTLTVLTDIAGLVATVVRLSESYVVLDTARADVQKRRAEERRALRRQLHDGLGPALAGVSYGLAAVENLMATDRSAARALLGELADEVRDRLRDVRDLAGEVGETPSEPDDLAPALRRLSRRLGDGLSVRIDVTGVELLDAARAEALHLIAAEALTNVARHARARTAEVRIAVDGEITLCIQDDGGGFAVTATAGVGLASMRERVAAFGGRFDITSSPKGTTVSVTMPSHGPSWAVDSGGWDGRGARIDAEAAR